MRNDESIWLSAHNLFRIQENLDKLFEAFNGITCNKPGLVIELDDCDAADFEWLQPVWNAYYSVKPNSHGRTKAKGWVTLAIQLTCEKSVEAGWGDGERAKVLAGYSPNQSFDDAWKFDTETPNSAGHCDGWVTQGDYWTRDEGKSWFFAVPLDELTSTDKVQDYLISPIQRILVGENPDRVLAEIKGALCPPPAS